MSPSGETNDALQPPRDTIAPIGWPVRSAKACGSPQKPIALRRSASCGICCGIHMPSSPRAAEDRKQGRDRDGFSRIPPREDGCANIELCPYAVSRPRQVFWSEMNLPKSLTAALDDLLTRAFAEEGEDITSLAVFGPAARVAAKMVCRERAVVSGAAFLPRLFAFLSPAARVALSVMDGDLVEPGAVLAKIEGPAITVLAAERTALNLVQRLTGIATMTRAYVDALKGTNAVLLDTRKTTPSLRVFERYAVRCGGGTNHRPGLSGAFLVKDNHADGAGSTWEATRRAGDFRALNRRLHGLLLEAEARTLDEVHQALDAGAERVLLDNMTTAAIRKAVEDVHLFNEATGPDVTTEASGRTTPETPGAAAEAGVDFVSAGALTHSARAIDIALDIVAGLPQPRLEASAVRKPLTRLLKIAKKKK